MRFLSLQYFPQIRIGLSVRTVLVKTMPVVKLLITAVLALVAVAIGGCYIASYRPLMPEVRPIEVEKKDRKEFLSFFYFSGGNPQHVVATWQDTPAWECLLQRWQHGLTTSVRKRSSYQIIQKRAREWINAHPAINTFVAMIVLFISLAALTRGWLWDWVARK